MSVLLVRRCTAVFFFFFQAEDGIRDDLVTGVQTCALPICSGEPLKNIYLGHGVAMLPEHATYGDDRGNAVEPGIEEMLERMRTGRFKVFRHLAEWFEEFRSYHREDGKVVRLRDDLMAATRYALMMKR